MKKLCTLLMLSCVLAFGVEFTCSLMVKGGQLEKVLFGCSSNGTSGYDRKLDIPAPPMGMNSGVIGWHVPNEDKQFILNQDMRGETLPQAWKLDCRTYRSNPIKLSWDPATLPKGLDFAIRIGEGQWIDMRESKALDVKETCFVEVKVEQKQAESK